MKTQRKANLTLNRETLVPLQGAALATVAGGAGLPNTVTRVLCDKFVSWIKVCAGQHN